MRILQGIKELVGHKVKVTFTNKNHGEIGGDAYVMLLAVDPICIKVEYWNGPTLYHPLMHVHFIKHYEHCIKCQYEKDKLNDTH